MRGEPTGHAGVTEGDYARAARDALARGDLSLALEQLGAALSFAPLSPQHLELLEVILSRAPKPLSLLPDRGEAFFGSVAVRAHALMRERRLGSAVPLLLDVAAFRPAIPYLVWLDRWTESGVRGVGLEGVMAGVERFAKSLDERARAESSGVRANVDAASRLLDKLAMARPRSGGNIAALRFELLRRLDGLDEVRGIAESAIAITDPVADVVRGVVSRSASDDAKGPVRVRVRVDTQPSPSAHVALVAALAELGREGSLTAVLPDGQAIAGAAPRKVAASSSLLERARALARSEVDLDAWVDVARADDPSPVDGSDILAPRDVAPLLDATTEGDVSQDPVHRLQRMRLAVLSLVSRGADRERLEWLYGLARAEDGWLAAAAIAVLSAIGRRRGEEATLVDRVLVAIAERAPSDARRDPLSRALLLMPSADEQTRQLARRMRLEHASSNTPGSPSRQPSKEE